MSLAASVDETGFAQPRREPGAGAAASVRKLLIWLMLAGLVPGALGAMAILYYSYQLERTQLAQATGQTARALTQAMDAEFARIQSLTQALAKSEHLANNRLAEFHAQALELVQLTHFDNNFVLSDATGQQLVNTLRPYPEKLPMRNNLELVREVFKTGQPAISGIDFSTLRQRPVMTVDVPVWRDGRVRYVLNFTTVPSAFLGEILKKQKLPSDWVVAFLDKNGKIALRSHSAERFVGQKGGPELLARMAEVDEGMLETHTLEGIPVTSVFSRSAISNWTVVIGIPTQAYTEKIRQRFFWLAAAIASLFGAGTFLALSLAKRIGGSIRALTEPALALGKGEVVNVPHLHLKEANEVGAALVTASHVLARAETLRRESDANHAVTANRLDAHLRNSPLALIELDQNFHIKRWSAQAESLFGWPRESMLGCSIFDPRWVHQSDVAEMHQFWAELKTGSGNSNISRHRNYRQDASIIHCTWYNSALRDADGNLVSILSQVLDVSKRTHAEAQMRIAMAAAEQANNAKSRFLAAASHDLRQPLAALSLYTGLLQKTAAASEQHVVAKMQTCIDGLSGLLNDLLDLSKLDAGVVTPSIRDFSVAEMLSDLQLIHAPEAARKGLRLRCRATRLNGHTDPVLLRRCLGNLMSNALRYTERGSVLVACRRRAGKTWIEVRDSGIGIAPEQTQEIFEEFRQLGDGARNQGSGLGLAIVAKTATLLGLQVSVRSQPARGSVFAIELPLGVAVLQAAPVADAPAALRPLCIALVDDNDLVREALSGVLRQLGHQVLASATQAALLAQIEQLQPDIVLTDYRLTGGKTGLEVIAAVRERLGPQFPAILITGDTDPQLLRSMMEQGIVVMHKSLNLELLQTYLAELTATACDLPDQAADSDPAKAQTKVKTKAKTAAA